MRFRIAVLLSATLGLLAIGVIFFPRIIKVSQEPDCQYLSSDHVNTMQVGRLLCILLEENQTTPYRWTYEISDDTFIEYVSDEYQSGFNPLQFNGVGGGHAFYFRATRAGTHSIEMRLARMPGNEGSLQNISYEAIQTISYEVVIEGPTSTTEMES